MAAKQNEVSQQPVTPEQAALQIRFALSELSSENAHHEFEHLCRHLTRLRICSNVIPSTGPVSGGGDQGIDFESYSVSPSLGSNPYFALATEEKWIFACSLEKNVKKKIRADLAAAAMLQPKPEKLYFFHHLPVKTSDRHKLQSEALKQYGIGLEVMDSKAISELLANPETVWVAERYLSLPSAFILVQNENQAHWYADLLKEDDNKHLTDGGFFKLRAAIREVAYTRGLQSDALKLFAKIRPYRNSTSDRIRRKAIYEEFVASLRGLGDATGYDADLRLYLADVDDLTDPADLEDAAAIISYMLGARVQEGLAISLEEIGVWHAELAQNTESLLAATNHVPRKCALSISKASLQLSQGVLHASKDYQQRRELIRSAATEAVSTWRSIVRMSKEAPLFPVERIANIADSLADLLDDLPGNDQLQKELDRVLRNRSGTQSSIDRQITRATAFQEAGKPLRALNEVHLAQVSAISSDDAVMLSLFLGKLYADLGLHFAAKHHSLSSAYAALKLPDERMRSFAYAGIAEAAAADYVTGGSLMMILSATAFVFVTHHFSMSGTEDKKDFEWSRIEYHLLQVAYWSRFVSETLQDVILVQLERMGIRELYNEFLPELENRFRTVEKIDDLDATALSERISPLFCDLSGRRNAAWTQLQIQWRVNWPTTYRSERFAETFCAYLQIILAELTDLELSILPGVAKVNLRFSEIDELKFEDVPDNTCVSRVVWVPSTMSNIEEERDLAAKVVYMFLNAFSAEKQETLLELLGPRIGERTPKIFSAYASNSRLFEEFYLEEDFTTLFGAALDGKLAARTPVPSEGHPDLTGPVGLHPNYNASAIKKQIARRYETIPPVIKYTLSKVKRSNDFIRTISELRADGWKDWHILLAVANVRINFVNTYNGKEPYSAFRERINKTFEDPELETDSTVPLEELGTENLRRALQFARLSTLANWGFQVRQQTPNHYGIDALLERLNYWTDDVPHPDLFGDSAVDEVTPDESGETGDGETGDSLRVCRREDVRLA